MHAFFRQNAQLNGDKFSLDGHKVCLFIGATWTFGRAKERKLVDESNGARCGGLMKSDSLQKVFWKKARKINFALEVKFHIKKLKLEIKMDKGWREEEKEAIHQL